MIDKILKSYSKFLNVVFTKITIRPDVMSKYEWWILNTWINTGILINTISLF